MQERPSTLCNSLVEGTTLLNTMTKCGGIESGGRSKNTLLNSERRRSPKFTRAILDGAGGMIVSIAPEGMRERGQMHPDRLWAFMESPLVKV